MNNFNLEEICKNAKNATSKLSKLNTNEKNNVLKNVAKKLVNAADYIIAANNIDISNARTNNVKEVMLDRLMLNKSRIEAMAEGIEKVAMLEDPIGEVLNMSKRPNGMTIG